MARLVKCPTCLIPMDVGNRPGGSVVACTTCGGSLRVPSGETGRVPTAKPPSTSNRMTPLFRKMAAARTPGGAPPAPSRPGTRRRFRSSSDSKAAIVMVVAACFVIVGALLVALGAGSRNSKPDPRPAAATVRPHVPEPEPEPEPEPAAPDRTPAPRKQPSLTKEEPGKYRPPDAWEPNARKHVVGDVPPLPVAPEVAKEGEELLKRGDHKTIVTRASRFLPAVLNLLASEDAELARAAFRALHAFCEEKKLYPESTNQNPINLSYLNSAYYRGSEFTFWIGQWWPKNKDRLDPDPQTKPPEIGAGDVDWDRLMEDLRPAGGYDNLSRPEGVAMDKLKKMGRPGWLRLVRYIEHQDMGIARAACAALNHLTGANKRLPTEQNRAGVKAEWEEWFAKN